MCTDHPPTAAPTPPRQTDSAHRRPAAISSDIATAQMKAINYFGYEDRRIMRSGGSMVP